MVYVTPTHDMVVRVGQHVTLEGRVYHHYLAHWLEAWDVSDTVRILRLRAYHAIIEIYDCRPLIHPTRRLRNRAAR